VILEGKKKEEKRAKVMTMIIVQRLFMQENLMSHTFVPGITEHPNSFLVLQTIHAVLMCGLQVV
jgi:hypothetical protein